jgi:uncharacterized membrane protein
MPDVGFKTSREATDRGRSHGTASDESAAEKGERRWPMAMAVVTAMVLTVLLPKEVRAGPPWLLPSLEGLVLVSMIAIDPWKISRQTKALQALSIGLVCLLVFDALWSTGWLVNELIHGGPATKSADTLLDAGVLIWFLNIIAFSLFYWELDGGGPVARFKHTRHDLDLAFPQQLSPEVASNTWTPLYVDYLYLGFTTATAFSPTDVMPFARWAKMSMMLQSIVSLVLVTLVVARAVNVLAA